MRCGSLFFGPFWGTLFYGCAYFLALICSANIAAQPARDR